MTHLSQDFKGMQDSKQWKEFWQPLHTSLDSIMDQTQANRYSKHFFGQHHLKALVLFHMTDGQSLEDLRQSLCEDVRFKVFTHSPSVSKSQLSRANAKRPVEAFHQTFLNLVRQLPSKSKLPRSLKDFTEHTRIFDGTCLSLNPNHCPWAIYRHQFQQPDAAMRMTLRLDLHSSAPDRVFVHPANDYSACYFEASLDLSQKGFLYLFDREFNEHLVFDKISASDNFFITRMKENNSYRVIESRNLSSRFRNDLRILEDQTIRLGKTHRLQNLFRRIHAIDRDGNTITFLTNLFGFAASTIAQLYRLRWKIETFFKWIKQHLKIKRFIAYSPNGILLQIYAALILYLLLALFKQAYRIKISLFNLLRKFRSKMSLITPILILRPHKFKLLNTRLDLLFQPLPLRGLF